MERLAHEHGGSPVCLRQHVGSTSEYCASPPARLRALDCPGFVDESCGPARARRLVHTLAPLAHKLHRTNHGSGETGQPLCYKTGQVYFIANSPGLVQREMILNEGIDSNGFTRPSAAMGTS